MPRLKQNNEKSEVKDKVIRVRFTQSDYERISAMKGTLSFSEWLRQSALKTKKISPVMRDVTEIKRLSVNLRQVGNLLNQIARGINTGKLDNISSEMILSELESCQEVLNSCLVELQNDN